MDFDLRNEMHWANLLHFARRAAAQEVKGTDEGEFFRTLADFPLDDFDDFVTEIHSAIRNNLTVKVALREGYEGDYQEAYYLSYASLSFEESISKCYLKLVMNNAIDDGDGGIDVSCVFNAWIVLNGGLENTQKNKVFYLYNKDDDNNVVIVSFKFIYE